MANPVGAVAHVPPVAPAHETQTEKPAANVTKVTPQDSVNISAAGKAASQAKPAAKPSGDLDHDGDSKKQVYRPSDSTGRDAGLRHNDYGVPDAVAFLVAREASRI